jgi:hypothetical protein
VSHGRDIARSYRSCYTRASVEGRRAHRDTSRVELAIPRLIIASA